MHQEWIEQNEHKKQEIFSMKPARTKTPRGLYFSRWYMTPCASFFFRPIVTVSYQRDTTTGCSFLWSSFLIEQGALFSGGTHTHWSWMKECNSPRLVSSSFFNLPFLKKAFTVLSLGCPFLWVSFIQRRTHNTEENLFRSVSRWCEDDMKEISMTLLKIIQTHKNVHRKGALLSSIQFSPFEQNLPLN